MTVKILSNELIIQLNKEIGKIISQKIELLDIHGIVEECVASTYDNISDNIDKQINTAIENLRIVRD